MQTCPGSVESPVLNLIHGNIQSGRAIHGTIRNPTRISVMIGAQLSQPVKKRLIPAGILHRDQLVIVAIQNNGRVLRHMVKHFRLGPQNTITVSQILQMTGPDVGDDTDIRPRNVRQAVHLTEVGDSHLNHSHLVLLPDP